MKSCDHCGQPVRPGEPHDCWTTTEAALTRDLTDELREAWERLRETAAAFGEQRIYASHHCIMFSRRACYFFVRPKARVLEICVFLGRTITAPQVRRTAPASRVKVGHILHIRHRDEVEAPITGWLREAYDVSDSLRALPSPRAGTARTAATSGESAPRARARRPPRAATTRARTPAAPAGRGKGVARTARARPRRRR